jgi:hypothetical protein
MKLDAKKALDGYARNLPTFAVLNPSLIAALSLMPDARKKRLCKA